jgi:hypothetical protein
MLADAIEKAAEDRPVVLIAGAGRARRDWGVPAQLAARNAGLEITSVALVEVSPELTQPSTYLPAGTGAAPVYDLLVFTLPAQRDDPCAILKDQLRIHPRPSSRRAWIAFYRGPNPAELCRISARNALISSRSPAMSPSPGTSPS